MWTESNPGAGDANAIRHQARLRSAKSAELELVHQTVIRAQAEAQSGEWRGLSADAFVAKLDTFLAPINRLREKLDGTTLALNAYAAAVEQVQSGQLANASQRRRISEDLDRRVRQIVDIQQGFYPVPP